MTRFGLWKPRRSTFRLKVALTVVAALVGFSARAQSATTLLVLRSDVNACFNNGSTSRTIAAAEGSLSAAEAFNLATGGSVTYDFYSAPLSATGPALLTSDKM